jgi:glycosyltransferase involved in cell wall biosynthesis
MTEHLVIFFAYHYPPKNTIGADRPYRFAKYLTRLGYICRVFTAAEQTGRLDPSVEYVPDPYITCPRSSFEWQMERAIRKLVLPGELGTQWSRRACQAARAFLRTRPGAPVTVFSTFPPLGSHLAAWQLVRAEGMPWIADFRDPFPDWSGHSEVYEHQRRVYRWLERAIPRRADTVIVNTDGALEQWQQRFPSLKGKLQVIWNGFDPEEPTWAEPIPPRSYKALSYVGSLYDDRVASPILESIERLVSAGRLAPGSVCLRLIGSFKAGTIPDAAFVERASRQGWLEVRDEWLPRAEAHEIARSSDGLLLILPHSTTQVQAKLFEYVQIGRPILAFVQPDSPTERLLKRSGIAYRCAYPGSAPEVMDDLVASFFALPSAPVRASAWFEEQFNAESQTRILDSLIRMMHSKQTSPARATGDRVKEAGISG